MSTSRRLRRRPDGGWLTWLLAVLVPSACADEGSSTRADAAWTDPATGIEFVLIEPGRFTMGLEADDVRPAPQHTVVLTKPFYLGRYEVTQAEWRAVTGREPSHFTGCDACPVESVTWDEVQSFIDRLNKGRSGPSIRLPTEAEWEYVCRAGQAGPYTDGRTRLEPELANYDPTILGADSALVARGMTVPAGSYPPNAWGVYDLHGNVWEWMEDEYCPYPTGEVLDPVQSCGTDTIPIRGGSWHFSERAALCGRRYTHHPSDRGFSLGFRLAREASVAESRPPR